MARSSRALAQLRGEPLVELGDLGEQDAMKAIGLFAHSGVAAHPGDAGMQEIAARMGCPAEQVGASLEAIVEPVSLFEPVYNDGGDSIYVMDQISDPSGTDEAWLDNIALREAVKKLTEREKKIIRMRFFQGKTQMEIAADIGISQAQVSRLEKGALARLKKHF